MAVDSEGLSGPRTSCNDDSGFNHVSYASRGMMSGIRSWILVTTEFASVVKIVQLLTMRPCAPSHTIERNTGAR